MAFDYDKFKKQFYNRVDALLTQNVYSKNAPENASYPFAVIKYLAASNVVMWKDNFYIDIDLWDDSNSTTELNNMVTTLRAGLHGYYSSSDNLSYRSYVDSPGVDITVEKPDLSRSNMRFLIYVF